MKRILQFVLIIAVVYALFTGYSLWTYGEEENIPEADAAIILGAAQWNGKPSPVFEGRLKQGIELYKEDKVDYLVFTGGMSKNAASSEAEVGKRYALERGIPKEDILLEDQSLVTEDNLVNAQEVAKDQGIDSYLLVSDQFHLKRAVGVAKSKGMNDVTGVPTKYSAYETLETKLPFFFREWAYLMAHQLTKLF
ncbi:YdcF family protein [Halobacillus sp. BBL2006]|uniref:YdcF family protein n=1 Tax=Halobacillus sp. BBL2006 TaxID=1543706 RepID=UPI000544523E|nr:YdcF family protein [Halobacillus sp. BBL2006]KHE72433.1 multidrug MFS transporter [Halobacillus sp. BBL2006]